MFSAGTEAFSCESSVRFLFLLVKLDPCEKNPCLNGGTCSMGVFHHYDHTCQCLPQFTGGTCESK